MEEGHLLINPATGEPWEALYAATRLSAEATMTEACADALLAPMLRAAMETAGVTGVLERGIEHGDADWLYIVGDKCIVDSRKASRPDCAGAAHCRTYQFSQMATVDPVKKQGGSPSLLTQLLEGKTAMWLGLNPDRTELRDVFIFMPEAHLTQLLAIHQENVPGRVCSPVAVPRKPPHTNWTLMQSARHTGAQIMPALVEHVKYLQRTAEVRRFCWYSPDCALSLTSNPPAGARQGPLRA